MKQHEQAHIQTNALDLDAIDAREKAATTGPWRWDRDWGMDLVNEALIQVVHCAQSVNGADGDFIAHAREDVPALIARVRDLERQYSDEWKAGYAAGEQLFDLKDRIAELEAACRKLREGADVIAGSNGHDSYKIHDVAFDAFVVATKGGEE